MSGESVRPSLLVRAVAMRARAPSGESSNSSISTPAAGPAIHRVENVRRQASHAAILIAQVRFSAFRWLRQTGRVAFPREVMHRANNRQAALALPTQTSREKGAAAPAAAKCRALALKGGGRMTELKDDAETRRLAGRARFAGGLRGAGARRRIARRGRDLGPPQGRETAVRRQYRLRQHDPAGASSRSIPATASWR